MAGESRGRCGLEAGARPFSDDALGQEGPNELVVAVWDPTFEGGYPRGKQIDKPGGIWYTPCSGIWQTVWASLRPDRQDGGRRST